MGASEVARCGLQRRGRRAKLNGDDAGGGNGNGTMARDKDESERVWYIPRKSVAKTKLTE